VRLLKKGAFLKSVFFIFAFALIIVVCSTSETQAFVSMSEDQVTCTPCHEDGRMGDGKGGEIYPETATPTETGSEGSGEADPILTKYQNTTEGNLIIAPAAAWDELWSWIQAQPVRTVENKYDELFTN